MKRLTVFTPARELYAELQRRTSDKAHQARILSQAFRTVQENRVRQGVVGCAALAVLSGLAQQYALAVVFGSHAVGYGARAIEAISKPIEENHTVLCAALYQLSREEKRMRRARRALQPV